MPGGDEFVGVVIAVVTFDSAIGVYVVELGASIDLTGEVSDR